MAATLVREGKRVGLMDIDMHGPSIAKLIAVRSFPMAGPGGDLQPAVTSDGLKVMSIGYMLRERDEAVIWRGPMKHGVIRQFLSEVEWGELDYLVVDSPPGTGDEPLSIAQLIQGVDGAVIVTTPQEVAVDDVRRSIGFCRKMNLPVIGVVENMSGFLCPHCGQGIDIFKRGGGAAMADQMKVPYLGEIPIDPAVVQACDEGVPFVQQCAESLTTAAFRKVIQPLLHL
jgi:Mrp family chromosome partitioning ATPase